MKANLTAFALLLFALLFQNCSDDQILNDRENAEDLTTEATAFKGAFTISAVVIEDSYPANLFRAYIEGTSGAVKVAWGDGSTTSYSLVPGNYTELYHEYKSPGKYLIKVTGDLKKITSFDSFYGEGAFNEINISGLTSLKAFQVGLSQSSSVIDLSANVNLERVALIGLNDLIGVVLPKKHKIKELDLSGSSSLDGPAVDAIINNIYKVAVAQKFKNGFINLNYKWYYEEGEPETFIGPPSATALNQLQQLKSHYQWDIQPNL